MRANPTANGDNSAYLRCGRCGTDSLHEVGYAGRLLHHTRCTTCGARTEADDDLPRRYLADLEHRVLTKPRRLARRARRHPLHVVAGLPAAMVRQPGKVYREVRLVLTDHEPVDRTPR